MNLNEQQLEAVKHENSPLLILAGAGTGKTTTIVNRIEYVIKNNSINPEEILALTFSVEAVKNLKKRLLERGVIDSQAITINTFHSFAKTIIDNNYLKLSYSSSPELIEKDDFVYFLLDRVDSFSNFSSRRFNRSPIKAIKSLLSIHDQFCQELFLDKDLENIKNFCLTEINNSSDESDEIYRQIHDSVQTFQEFKNIKREFSFIEYEDMIYDFWNLIDSDLKILSSLQEQYKFIIIDEFQDNNFAFSEIINKIASHKNITVVGDDDQSIYSFRGANSYNMHHFDHFYSSEPNYKKIELTTNYRSSQKILDIANSVIVNNDSRMDKKLLFSELDIYDDLVKLYVGSKDAQLHELINEIQSFQNKGLKKTIAILCRTHLDCAVVSEALSQHQISHDYTNEKLFEQKIIKDIVAVFNVYIYSKYSFRELNWHVPKFMGLQRC